MKFLQPKVILASGALVSLFMGAILVSCHSMGMAEVNTTGNFLALPITQSLSEPCCMVQGGNYGLHSLPLATITSTTLSQNNVPEVAGSPVWFQDTVREAAYNNQGPYLGNTAEVPLHNYLVPFIAQGLLQPQIYGIFQASA